MQRWFVCSKNPHNNSKELSPCMTKVVSEQTLKVSGDNWQLWYRSVIIKKVLQMCLYKKYRENCMMNKVKIVILLFKKIHYS